MYNVRELYRNVTYNVRVVYKAFYKLDIWIKRAVQWFCCFRYAAIFVSIRRSLPETQLVQRKLQAYGTLDLIEKFFLLEYLGLTSY